MMARQSVAEQWNERYTNTTLGIHEFMDFSQEDFDRLAKRYADAGYTQLGFSPVSHWRWSFHPWWKQMNLAMALYIRSIHRYGMKAIEHHSTTLFYNPDGSNWPPRQSGLDLLFQGIFELWRADDDTADGVPIASMRQISGMARSTRS